MLDPNLVRPWPIDSADKSARRERRVTRFEEIKDLINEGYSLREVARRTGMARNTVLRLAGCEQFPETAARPPRKSKIAPFADHLRRRWSEGCCNATRLHREITALGFTGNVSAVQRSVQSWREKPRSRINGRHPHHPRVTDEQRGFLGRLSERCPTVAAAQELSLAFCHLVRERRSGEFAAWLEQVAQSDVAEFKAFARGLAQDRKAVEAGLSLVWSNGQVEGQVNRLKTLKRQMYGRASFDLLRARVLPSSKAA